MRTIAMACGAALCFMGMASAQENGGFAFNVGAGFTTPLGTVGQTQDTGWNVRGGVGWNFTPRVGALVDLGYHSMGINSTTLADLGYAGGRLSIFSATFDPIIHLNPRGRIGVYVTGGGGLYHEYQDFTQPALGSGIGFGLFGYYPYTYQGNIVVASASTNKPGFDAGIGVEMGSRWHGKFFAEARYNRIFNNGYHTDFLPVTFGFRW